MKFYEILCISMAKVCSKCVVNAFKVCSILKIIKSYYKCVVNAFKVCSILKIIKSYYMQ